ncbi:MAG: hypothetical protein AB7O52_14585 [Planctomycetota bacterium]
MQPIERSPFLSLDQQRVVGFLRSIGTRDPDVLHAQKANLDSLAKFPKYVGVYLMVLGGLLTATVLGAFLGIPLLIFGWWVRRRGVRNIATVEAGYGEFMANSGAAAA